MPAGPRCFRCRMQMLSGPCAGDVFACLMAVAVSCDVTIVGLVSGSALIYRHIRRCCVGWMYAVVNWALKWRAIDSGSECGISPNLMAWLVGAGGPLLTFLMVLHSSDECVVIENLLRWSRHLSRLWLVTSRSISRFICVIDGSEGSIMRTASRVLARASAVEGYPGSGLGTRPAGMWYLADFLMIWLNIVRPLLMFEGRCWLQNLRSVSA